MMEIPKIKRKFRFFGRLWRRNDGAAAVEFAFVAPILLVTIIGIMEVAMVLIVSTLIEGGLRDAARFGITGFVPQGMTRAQQITTIISDATIGLVKLPDIDIQTLVYPSFSQVGQPEPYTDTNSNGAYDAGEPFTDINANGQWDADMGAAGVGGPGDIVLYKVKYNLPTMTPLLSTVLGGADGKVQLSASIAVRNEPYPSSTVGGGGT